MLVMMGLNPAHEERLSVRALSTSDRVIVLGTSLDVAQIPGRHYEEWDLSVNSLEELVESLAAELLSASTPSTVALREGKKQLVAQQVRRLAAAIAHHRKQFLRRLASARRRVHAWIGHRPRRGKPDSE